MNYFHSKSNLLTSEECEQFISRIDKESLPLSPWYKCVYANLYDYDFLEKKVREAVIEYINLHPFLNNIPMEWHIDASMNLQWYGFRRVFLLSIVSMDIILTTKIVSLVG